MPPASASAVKPSAWSRFGVEPSEERSAAWMLAHSAFMGFATVFFETAASALFLGKASASSLPSVYLAAAALSAATGYSYSKLQNKLSFSNLMTATMVGLFMVVASLRGVLVFTQWAGLFFFAMVFYRVLSILTDLEYWAVAGRLYDLRQAKRLFGFIGTGEVMARIVGSFSVPLLLKWGGVPNLLVLSALGLLGCVIALRRVLPMIPDDDGGPKASSKEKAERSSMGSLVRDPYLRFVLIVAFCGILGKYLVDFAFLQQVKSRFSDAKEVASFFALFSGISQCASLFTRVFLSGRVLAAIGVHRGLLILPGAHVICTTLLLVAGGLAWGPNAVFWLVVFNQGIYKSLKHPIDNPSLKTLYQPIPKDRRLSLTIAVEALLNPAGIALSSALMLLFTSVFHSDPVRFGWVLLACFLFWLFSARAAAAEYVRALVVALRGRIEDVAFAFDDEAAVDSLRQTLKSGSEEDALVALQILGDHAPGALSPMLVDLVRHPSKEVRRAALERIEAHRPEGIADVLRTRLTDEPEDTLRALALRALSAVAGESSKEELTRYVKSPFLLLREAALLGLIRMNAPEGMTGLKELAESKDPAERSVAARLLRLEFKPDAAPMLRTLIEDDDLAVSRLALFAAGDARSDELLPLLIARVTKRGVLGAARASIALSGDMALPHITRSFELTERSDLRRGLIAATSRIKSEGSTGFLFSKLEVEDIAVRQDVIRALAHGRFVATSPKDRDYLEGLARKEAKRALETLAMVRDLQTVEGTDVLCRALQGSHRNTRERLLMLLGFTRDPKALLAVRTHIDGGHKDRRAYAQEILDVVLTREERALFMPAVEGAINDVAPEQILALGLVKMSATDRIKALFLDTSFGFENWIRAAALEAAPRMKAPGLDAAIETFLQTSVGSNFQNTGERSLSAIRGLLRAKGVGPMLLIEKVIALKAVEMFARTPEDVLADVAALAEEVRFKAGDTIFEKGAAGEGLYVIVQGEVKVHDGDLDLKHLGDRTVFGELAVLDPEPRSASITALKDSHLLRLDREAFLELMAGNMEVVRGVLSVLCDRIREKLIDAKPPKAAPAKA
ncbi:MAG: HEAT repeat domain-containing protein [Vicinamibacteria bacterium]